MLETEEVDDDYFTPVSSTSLANIFGKKSQKDDQAENESLKYVPPKPHNILKPEESKATQCVFACALIGHEWINNTYTSRGKLGFAILKILKNDTHNIVLYDANKTTVSCTLISPKLEVVIKGNDFISYYDNLQKYWSIYATEAEVKKIIELLKNMGVIVKKDDHTDTVLPEPQNIEIDVEKANVENKESDTDSSINRKTKETILSRMASMGHSVLPPQTVPTERTSDSSDTNDNINYPKTIRHKPIKSIVKRNNDRHTCELQNFNEIISKPLTCAKPTLSQAIPLYTYVSGQLVPVPNIDNTTSSSNDVNYFLTEQRISNSELRINMNRVTDKIDKILNKFDEFDSKSKDSNPNNINTEILLKLLTEYENKIKVYENLLASKGIKDLGSLIGATPSENQEVKLLKEKIAELSRMNSEKGNEVVKLQEEFKFLKEKYSVLSSSEEESKQNNDELIKTINNLENNLSLKNEELLNATIKFDNMAIKGIDGDKIKSIMNNTFRAIAVNFESNVNYSGETIKNIIATVIKKVTIESLNEI